MAEQVILEFKAFAVETKPNFYGQMRVEARINESFEQHAHNCQSCRTLLLRDLRDFLAQLEKEL